MMEARRKSNQVIVCGAGGHAFGIIDALLLTGLRPAYIVDDDPLKHGRQIAGFEIVGGVDSAWDDLQNLPVIVAVARNDIRRKMVEQVIARGGECLGVVHPRAIISRFAEVQGGVQILAGAVVNPGCVIHAHAILNTGCVVDHDCSIGQFSHIGPGAVLAGGVKVADQAFIGAGASVLPMIEIGHASTLGAGAVAVRNVADGITAVGIPAQTISVKGQK